jgi:DNA replication protein DnaC
MTTDHLLQRATALKLYGVLSHWEEISQESWLKQLITWEESERTQRGLERRIQNAHLYKFKSLSEFDWSWPKKCNREVVEELMQLAFLDDATNIILCGPNGVGKTMLACNIAHQAVLHGHAVLFTTAGKMLNDLASQDGDNALRRRIKHYTQPSLLCIDELGQLSYSNRHADLLFEIIAQRYEKKSTLITTNKTFSEWNTLFPNAGCVVSLIDRLVHNSEIINIEGDSFRFKESKERSLKRERSRTKNKGRSKIKCEEKDNV